MSTRFCVDTATVRDVADHLDRCDRSFIPPLSDRVQIADYAEKICDKATRFEAWNGQELVGLIAAYCNDDTLRMAYVTSVSVLRECQGSGIASRLMAMCVDHVQKLGFDGLALEVSRESASAVRLYERNGFRYADGRRMVMQFNRGALDE